MPKLIFLKGLPGSGKSTWAREQVRNSGGKIKRVNKDDLREMVDAGVWSKKNEKEILAIRDELVGQWLMTGWDVIVDDTNFAKSHEDDMRQISEFLNAEFEIKFFDTPLEECIRRDAKRDKPVGKNVILQMWNQYLKPEPPKYNPELPDCIICDIDGTLALFDHDKNPYDRDFSKDKLSYQVGHVVDSFLKSDWTNKCIIFSGRDDKFEGVTRQWLDGNWILYDELHMRKHGDNRSDDIVKREMYEQFIKDKYNVFFVIDDRPKVVRLWKLLGLFVFDVGPGFEF